MQIVRGVKENPDEPFVAVLRAAALDPNLSLKELGALCRLLARPDDWSTDYKQTARESADGHDSVRRAFGGLTRKGYMARRRVRDRQGRIRTLIALSDVRGAASALLGTETGKPGTGEPGTGLPRTGEPSPGVPNAGEPSPGAPKHGAPKHGKPGTSLRQRDQDRDTNTRPAASSPPVPPEVLLVVGAMREELRRRDAPRPAQPVLVELARQLHERGWGPDEVSVAIAENDWTGARAGAVVNVLRSLAEEPPRSAARLDAQRPEWCGACDPLTRMVELSDGRSGRCPDCNPRAGTPLVASVARGGTDVDELLRELPRDGAGRSTD